MPSHRTVYLDNNATTRLDEDVLDTMLPFLREQWGNAGSGHHVGRPVARAVNAARRSVADRYGVRPGDVVFCAGATEADNLALRGSLAARPDRRHLVTTAVEHPAVLDCARMLESEGLCELSIVGVDGQGRLDVDALEAALRPGETALVSVMGANNETGVVLPLAEVAARARAAGAWLHVDAVQLVGKSTVDPIEAGADLIALSAHKFHGPKGLGALILRRGIDPSPIVHGGGQEKGRRPGTLNAPGIVGFARALERVDEEDPTAIPRMRALRERLESGLSAAVADLEITGAGVDRVANTTHVTVPGVEAEALLVQLDREGIACSAGSACSTGALEPSPVLVAMGIAPDRLHGALRLSTSRETTEADVDRLLEVLPPVVARLRALT
ncbi:MAG TPA: cysteine desulfurase family protein, partial [Candidatus Krumholzibacteria bacterium]|nr:cysteine desulfurase family protein [Candidatus Krumholzibacteria bacterium]